MKITLNGDLTLKSKKSTVLSDTLLSKPDMILYELAIDFKDVEAHDVQENDIRTALLLEKLKARGVAKLWVDYRLGLSSGKTLHCAARYSEHAVEPNAISLEQCLQNRSEI